MSKATFSRFKWILVSVSIVLTLSFVAALEFRGRAPDGKPLPGRVVISAADF